MTSSSFRQRHHPGRSLMSAAAVSCSSESPWKKLTMYPLAVLRPRSPICHVPSEYLNASQGIPLDSLDKDSAELDLFTTGTDRLEDVSLKLCDRFMVGECAATESPTAPGASSAGSTKWTVQESEML
mmetsp:Transcript_17727/g.49098  ORF Transcript_17727/g.49098 Transcript_17727/m.49098 type:complete len:127 (+) Transcript_17727:346-726(+)